MNFCALVKKLYADVNRPKIDCAWRFWTTLEFGREYLRNGSRHQQLKTNLTDCHSFRVGPKKWWTLVHQQKSYRRSCWPTQNRLCAQFWTILNFSCQYLRNGSRGQQLKTNLIDRHHFRVWRKKIGELWSTNKKVIGADVDLLNSTMRILRVLMHFSSGHVILLGYFDPPPKLFTQSDLRRRAASRWALSHIFTFSLRSFQSHWFWCQSKETHNTSYWWLIKN